MLTYLRIGVAGVSYVVPFVERPCPLQGVKELTFYRFLFCHKSITGLGKMWKAHSAIAKILGVSLREFFSALEKMISWWGPHSCAGNSQTCLPKNHLKLY